MMSDPFDLGESAPDNKPTQPEGGWIPLPRHGYYRIFRDRVDLCEWIDEEFPENADFSLPGDLAVLPRPSLGDVLQSVVDAYIGHGEERLRHGMKVGRDQIRRAIRETLGINPQTYEER